MNPALDLTSRHFFHDCGIGVGKMALASLLVDSLGRPAAAAAPPSLLAPKPPHFPGRARAVMNLDETIVKR